MVKKYIPHIIALVITVIILINNAWIGDDGYITFRTVDNFVNGYGLTWNIAERVQAYTHPLWMFYITFFYFFTSEIYYTTIAVSIITSLAAIYILTCKVAINKTTTLLSLLLLLSCKSFIDYTTSGLENPLTYLLLVIFYFIFLKKELTNKNVLLLSFITSLAMINRLDTILLYLPVLVYIFFKFPIKQSIKTFFIGFSIFFSWELFSLIYYGFLIPNTGFAKLSTGIDKYDLLVQGYHYYISTLLWSPITLLVIFICILYYFVRPSLKFILPILGIILYLLYIFKIGGCYMTGRFFATPFLLSIILLSQIDLKWKSIPTISVILVVIASLFYPSGNPIISSSDIGISLDAKRWYHGISDERAAWYKTTGMLVQNSDSLIPNHVWTKDGIAMRTQKEKIVYRAGIGLFGYFAGADIFIIDGHALPNPLTARLPIADLKKWRIGHFFRKLPVGYLESIKQNKNLIQDKNLAEYYDKIRQITHDSIFSIERLTTILKMNFGKYHYLIEAYIMRPKEISYAKINTSKTIGTNYNCPTCNIIDERGLLINLESTQHTTQLEISVDHNDNYLLSFILKDSTVGTAKVNKRWIPERGLRIDSISVPTQVTKIGFDQILITPIDGDGKYSVGHLKILQ